MIKNYLLTRICQATHAWN